MSPASEARTANRPSLLAAAGARDKAITVQLRLHHTTPVHLKNQHSVPTKYKSLPFVLYTLVSPRSILAAKQPPSETSLLLVGCDHSRRHCSRNPSLLNGVQFELIFRTRDATCTLVGVSPVGSLARSGTVRVSVWLTVPRAWMRRRRRRDLDVAHRCFRSQSGICAEDVRSGGNMSNGGRRRWGGSSCSRRRRQDRAGR